jgi:predicted transcriptional regulator
MTRAEQQKANLERLDLANKLKAEGLTGKYIAERLGISPGRVSQMIGKRRTKLNEPHR